MNGGDCSTCRREKYCHSRCRDFKDLMRRLAAQAYREALLKKWAEKNPKQEVSDGRPDDNPGR